MSIETMKLALKTLEALHEHGDIAVVVTPECEYRLPKAITSLRQAIAEAEKQEPVGYLEIEDVEDQREYPHNCRAVNLWYEGGEGLVAVYTHPQPKRAVSPTHKPLTDDEIWKNDNIMAANSGYGATLETLREVVRAVEAAHGIKGEA